MRALSTVLTWLAAASCLWAVSAAVRMCVWLSRQGVAVNWFWFRLFLPWYVQRYRTLTQARGGRPGPLFSEFVVTINLALLLGVAAVITRVAGSR